jgi:hypothetical protein
MWQIFEQEIERKAKAILARLQTRSQPERERGGERHA